jgi:hypothetical protein
VKSRRLVWPELGARLIGPRKTKLGNSNVCHKDVKLSVFEKNSFSLPHITSNGQLSLSGIISVHIAPPFELHCK